MVVVHEPCWLRQQRICLQCKRPQFDPWVGTIPWRREWQPTPAFLLGESHRQRTLAGYSPWGCKESDTTKQLTHTRNDCFKIEKGVRQGCLLSPCLFNLHTEHMKNAGLGELQAGIKIGRRNINVRYADDTTLMAESEETKRN